MSSVGGRQIGSESDLSALISALFQKKKFLVVSRARLVHNPNAKAQAGIGQAKEELIKSGRQQMSTALGIQLYGILAGGKKLPKDGIYFNLKAYSEMPAEFLKYIPKEFAEIIDGLLSAKHPLEYYLPQLQEIKKFLSEQPTS
jgi:hypothetical protein